MVYKEFTIEALEIEKNEIGDPQFLVRVFYSPSGEGPFYSMSIPSSLKKELYLLENRKLNFAGMVHLGEILADFLLPKKSRSLLISSLDKLSYESKLRIRLRLPPSLSALPWEYMYIKRSEGENSMSDFLALDSRISIVRHEEIAIPGDFYSDPKERRLLVAASSPDNYPSLNLDQEMEYIKEAVSGIQKLHTIFLINPTLDELKLKLQQQQTDVFHFAGHGLFMRKDTGELFGSSSGEGAIVLVAEDNKPLIVTGEELAINLQGSNVKLVILDACETGKCDYKNVWSSITAALMKVGIPITVAMQYEISDENAIVFSRDFYQALATGLPVDQAVSLGRLSIFNCCSKSSGSEKEKIWRDWGAPVLYLRISGDFFLPVQNYLPEIQNMSPQFFNSLIKYFKEQLGDSRKIIANLGIQYASENISYQVNKLLASLKEVGSKDITNDPQIVYDLGILSAYNKDYAAALGYVHQAILLGKDDPDVFYSLAGLQHDLANHEIEKGNYGSAISRIAEANEAAKKLGAIDEKTILARGYDLLELAAETLKGNKEEMKHLDETDMHLSWSMQLNPLNVSTLQSLDDINLSRDKIDAEIKANNQYLKLFSSHPMPHRFTYKRNNEMIEEEPEKASDRDVNQQSYK